jgi:hypothetical protein
MNLIMSDVEESIMIVENPENPANPNIKVSSASGLTVEHRELMDLCVGREKECGDAVRSRGWRNIGELLAICVEDLASNYGL